MEQECIFLFISVSSFIPHPSLSLVPDPIARMDNVIVAAINHLMSEVSLLFLGTGTSAGVPMIGCHCEVCSSSDPRDKRTRPSVVISYNGRHILVDTTPELRLQCVANRVDHIDAVVYTHAHADHIMGLDDVRRFNAISKGPLDVYADERTHATLQKCFGYAFKEPDPSSKLFRPHLSPKMITEKFELFGETWWPAKLMHANQEVLGFRVGNLAYCTDVSFIPEESFQLLAGLDVLVLDALQDIPHVSHFSLSQATEAAKRIGAKQTWFTHIAHRLGHKATNRSLPGNMQLAHDGLRVTTES
jgi:phosphoribosyl 1,2-cyclic phosphate phosphodiesterase